MRDERALLLVVLAAACSAMAMQLLWRPAQCATPPLPLPPLDPACACRGRLHRLGAVERTLRRAALLLDIAHGHQQRLPPDPDEPAALRSASAACGCAELSAALEAARLTLRHGMAALYGPAMAAQAAAVTSFAAGGLDARLLREAFAGRANASATFLEVGAGDGLASVTRMLENAQWQGVCVEWDADAFARLEFERPWCTNVLTRGPSGVLADAPSTSLGPMVPAPSAWPLAALLRQLGFGRLDLLVVNTRGAAVVPVLHALDLTLVTAVSSLVS